MTRWVRWVLLAGTGLPITACSDDHQMSPDPVGSIEVTTVTTGEDIGDVVYMISVDQGDGQAIGPNATLLISGLAAGNHLVELTGMAPNCSVAGSNPRTVTVSQGRTMVTFDIACIAAVGSLEVTTATAGEDITHDGYMIALDQEDRQAIGLDETLTLSGLPTADYRVELAGVPSNCSVGGSPRTIAVKAAQTVVTVFEVTCLAVAPSVLTDQIAFESNRTGDSEIYVMNADGSEPRRLTNHPAYDGVPAISPGGTRILFESSRDGNSEIFVMNANGTGVENLSNHPASDERPSWSPDGSRILFVSDRDGDLDIFVMSADGSEPVNLTNSPGRDRPAHWSPDGSRIAFASDRTGDFEIFVMNADGSNPVNLTHDPNRADFAPAWSPDGTRLAYTSRHHEALSPDIMVMNADGSDPMNLTNNPAIEDRWPNWSPDGQWIAFSTNRTGDYEVFAMKADGIGLVNLSKSPLSSDWTGWPQTWSPAKAAGSTPR